MSSPPDNVAKVLYVLGLFHRLFVCSFVRLFVRPVRYLVNALNNSDKRDRIIGFNQNGVALATYSLRWLASCGS